MKLEKVSQLLYQLKIVNQEMTAKFEKSTGYSITRYQLMMILKCKGRSSQSQLQNELNPRIILQRSSCSFKIVF